LGEYYPHTWQMTKCAYYTVAQRFQQEGLLNQLMLTAMNNLLYVIAVILLIGWLVGVFVFSLTKLVHLLLVFAVIAVLVRIIRGDGI